MNERKVIEKCGIISSIIGIFINIFLTITKFWIGTLTNSISIKADAVNNLSDASSSIVSLISFKYSNKPADKMHPFGHERFEYVATFVVSAFILNYGLSVFIDSIKKIINNDLDININNITFLILILSILFKLFMFSLNLTLSKRIGSNVLKATAIDSLSDVLATVCISISLIIYKYFGINIDGYVGVIVSLFIIISGIKIIREANDNILGLSFDKDISKNIINFIEKYDTMIIGTHDLIVHNYGSKNFGTIHVEVSYKEDFLKSHDIIDLIEKDVLEKFNVNLVIHLDPVVNDNEYVNDLRAKVLYIIKNIDSSLNMHDFRMVFGETHNNLIFEVEVPFDLKINNNDILYFIENEIKKIKENLYCSIKIDRI